MVTSPWSLSKNSNPSTNSAMMRKIFQFGFSWNAPSSASIGRQTSPGSQSHFVYRLPCSYSWAGFPHDAFRRAPSSLHARRLFGSADIFFGIGDTFKFVPAPARTERQPLFLSIAVASSERFDPDFLI